MSRAKHSIIRRTIGIGEVVTVAPIYLDFNASIRINPAVASAMRPFLDGAFGNASSSRWPSAPTKAALERARGQVAALLGAAEDEIVFTSGGSEANNLALKGTFYSQKDSGEHIITTAVEHQPFVVLAAFSAAGRDSHLSAHPGDRLLAGFWMLLLHARRGGRLSTFRGYRRRFAVWY